MTSAGGQSERSSSRHLYAGFFCVCRLSHKKGRCHLYFINPLNLRDDTGALWENYLVMERLKKQEYTGISCTNYFWRTYDKK